MAVSNKNGIVDEMTATRRFGLKKAHHRLFKHLTKP